MDKDVAINYTTAHKEILKGLNQSSSIGALTYRKGKIEFVNQYLVELLEYKSKKELVGKPIEEVIEGKGEEFINTASVEYRTLSLKSKTKELIPAEAFSHSIQYGDETITLMIFINKSEEASFRKLFLALSQISQLSATAESEKELISGICNTMVEVVGYYSATIGVVDEKTKLYKVKYTRSKSKGLEEEMKKSLISVDPSLPYGRGTVSRCYRTGKITLLTDIYKDEGMSYWRKEQVRFGVRSACSIPIFSEKELRYILLIHDSSRESFTEKQLQLLEKIQAEASSALKRVKMQKELALQQKAAKIQSQIYNTLYHINKLYMEAKSKEKLLKRLPELLCQYLGVDIALYIQKEKENTLLIKNYSVKRESDAGFVSTLQKTLNTVSKQDSLDEIPLTKACRTKRVYLANRMPQNAPSSIKEIHKKYGIKSGCAMPVLVHGECIGALALLSRQGGFFHANMHKLLTVLSSEVEFMLNKIESEQFSQIIITALNTSSECVVITDEDFKIVYANENASKMSGYSREELIGKDYTTCLQNTYNEALRELVHTLKEGNIFSGHIVYNMKNGDIKRFYSIITPVKTGDETGFYVIVSRDTEKEDFLKRELEKLQHYDSITGLHSKLSLEKNIELFVNAEPRKKSKGALAIISPSHLSDVNKVFGLEAGNKILKQIAQRIKSCTREYDIAARIESENFAIFMKNVARDKAISIMQRLMVRLTKPYTAGKSTITLSFNIGVSLYPQDGSDAKTLLDRANVAMLDAKQRGKNTVGLFEKHIHERSIKEWHIKTAIKNAVDKGEFVLYYQPYVDRKVTIAGAESLLRWEKNGKIIPPGEFIPYLENMDIITDVEYRNFETIAKELKELSSIMAIPISTNFCHRTISRDDLLQQITSRVKEYLAGKKLVGIEIVERSFIENLTRIKRLINELKEVGVFVSIDDFGTGYSSLSYLAQLPADYLKIDISFIRDIVKAKHIQSIVRSIIFLAKEINMKTIAEGVETKEQFEMLKEMGCDYFQGYLFFKPMPEKAFKEVLRASSKKVYSIKNE